MSIQSIEAVLPPDDMDAIENMNCNNDLEKTNELQSKTHIHM